MAACYTMLLAAATTAAPQRIMLPDDVVPSHYDLSLTPDAKALTFTAKVGIDLEVKRPTASIILNAADLVFDTVALAGETAAPSVSFDAEQQTVKLVFEHPIAAGPHRLSIDYHGQVYQQASGLFALDYDSKDGKARALFTQFEASDARRMLPCFDEPARKASFTLSALVPAGQMAISNMPVVDSQQQPNGLQLVKFAETPRMSSYLLFFGLGDFERLSRLVDGVELGVIVKRGDLDKAAFALDAEAQILPFYGSYFGTKYPLPKLDLIAGPGTSQTFGAMENWGAIFSFESVLEIDSRIATEDDRQEVYLVTAHEMAHQWFGDLVTMSWWDDLWLNEGFASWMENKAIEHFHPEWHVWLQQLNAKQSAMVTDARDGSHPVVTPILDVLQAANAFDNITYNKGASVIRMLEAYVGDQAWQAGIQRYMADHAYGNATTDELWREIDAAGPRTITKIAHDFTLQSGVPQINVASQPQGLHLTLHRYGLDQINRRQRDWRVPVLVGEAGKNDSHGLLVSQKKPQTIGKTTADWIVNFGQTGYFRTLYDRASFAKVRAAFAKLSPEDQLGLLNDSRSLAEARSISMADFLDLAAKLPEPADPVVWLTLVGGLQRIDRLYDGLAEQARYRAFVQGRLRPVAARLGWQAKLDDPVNCAAERSAVLILLGRIGDPEIVAEARRRFAKLVQGETLEPTERRAVLAIVADNADVKLWDELHHLAQAAPSLLEKTEYYTLLGHARDPALAQKALQLSLSGEAEPTTSPGIIRAVADYHPAMAVKFASEKWDSIKPMLETMAHNRYVPDMAANASDSAILESLAAFAKAHIPPTGDSELRKVKAQIRTNIDVRGHSLPEIDRWLSDTA
jgi:aminopeptidase N